MEIKCELKVFRIDKCCPKCHEGVMRDSGTMLTSLPPKFHHTCTNDTCGYEEDYLVMYPYTSYEVADE